ncbi:TRAP-type uncharacterized transport system fused permease subunit [Bradyrhizobium ottawaense]
MPPNLQDVAADLSPPVALAALAAAPIAKENPDKIGWEAMRIALAGYVIPFIFVYSPALMLQAGDPIAAKLGFYGAVALATVKALVAIGLFGMVAIGFLFTRLTLIERLVALGAAFCLLGGNLHNLGTRWIGSSTRLPRFKSKPGSAPTALINTH